MPGRRGRGGRKRFGVSLPEDLADRLTILSEKLGVDRSRLVEEAVRAYLEDYNHLQHPHKCRGILIIRCPDWGEARRISEEHRRIISNIVHEHSGDYCYEALFIEGDSTQVSSLYSSILKAGCKARYIPLPPP